MYYADSLAFLGVQGGPIQIEKDLNLNLAHLTAAPPWMTEMKQVDNFINNNFKPDLKKHPQLKLVSTAEDITTTPLTNIILGLQNCPHDVDVGRLCESGIRILAFAYNHQNIFGSGFFNLSIGLTPDGAALVQKCLDYNIIIDISHAGHQMARDILDIMKRRKISGKVIVTHSACYSFYPHIRNLTDGILTDIANLGGVIGIPTVTFFLDNKDKGLQSFTKHLRHAINLCGENAICIGSDGCYIKLAPEIDRDRFNLLKEKFDKQDTLVARYPEHPIELNGANRMEVLDANISFIGSSIKEKILGINFFQYLKQNLT